MLLTLAEIKAQCILEADDTSEDILLTSYAMAASARLESELGRTVYATRSEIPANDTDALALEEMRHGGEDLKLAMKLLIGHYYANRESTNEVRQTIVPEGFRSLTSSYRLIHYGGN